MTETNLTRPQGLNRLDPVLREAASELGVVEFRAESLPTERERANKLAAERAAAVNTDGVDIESLSIAGPDGGQLGLRLYRGRAEGTSGPPLALYAHGGGFVTGNLDTDHAQCAELARAAGCLLVSVDYRLAPEDPCPAALNDLEAALHYVIDNSAELDADPGRIAVMGRDAGAALVAGLAQQFFDNEGPRILMQILHQPMLDCDATPSRREFQRTPGLTVNTSPRTGRTWRGCRPRSSAARRSTRAVTRRSPTPAGCCMPSSTPNYMSSRRRSTASTLLYRIGLCLKRTWLCTPCRCAAYSRCSGPRK
jgi:acetyl esterase/lipase